jgi:16S rRNA (guanine966-N2)-methyltransferase
MGIEALSRGARYCLFVDNSAESRALIRQNVETLALTGMTKIWRRDAIELGPLTSNSGGPFELAFIDPPYRWNLLAPALQSLHQSEWLVQNAIVVAEHAADETAPEFPCFEPLDKRSYGETSVAILRFGVKPS